MCVGARIANNELYGIAARLVQDYKIKLDASNPPIERNVLLLMRPSPIPKLNFIKRK